MTLLTAQQSLCRSEKGIALPLVLWVLTILSVLVLSFAFTARTETRSTLNFRELTEKKLLAEAGIERAVMEIFYRGFFAGQTQSPDIDELKVWKTDGTIYREALGEGYYTVSIMDESGKISINGLTETSGIILKNLLVRLGTDPDTADTIVDSILDWKDPDELHRVHGAESDYYLSLPNPYKAKNAEFDTVEELLLVKGMTPEILFGSGDRRGLAPYVTVYLADTKINALAAPGDVLLSLPGMTEAAVQRILAYREAAVVPNMSDVQGLLADIGSAVSPYLSSGTQNTFSLTSIGQRPNDKKGYAISTTIVVDQSGRYRSLYYKSPSETGL
jgi:general secretion pathway protein K